MKLKTWSQIYPQGTKAGDEEQKFFIGKNKVSGLARHPDYQWRSIASIVKESGLTRERVEEILNKYYNLGMVFAKPGNSDLYGYWERCPEMVTPKPASLSTQDKTNRINNHIDDC